MWQMILDRCWCVMWIFFIFWSCKIRISPTSIASSLSPPRCCLSPDQRHHTVVSCQASFLLSQDELAVSSGNALCRRLPSQAETEVLNSHHHRRLPSPNHQTLILHCYKKIISTLVTLPTTQSRLRFAPSLAGALCHRSSTRRCRSLSPLSHIIVHPHNDIYGDKLANPLLLPSAYKFT
jgi:hypothetical protein